MKYKITFEFLNGLGEWKKDDFDNNGEGFNSDDAQNVFTQLKNDNVCKKRNIQIVEM